MPEVPEVAGERPRIIILTSRPQFQRGIVGPRHGFDIPAPAREEVGG